MKQRLIPAIVIALAAAHGARAAPSGGLAPTYTDVAACAAEDLGPDEFVRSCEGPGGAGAVLHYFDGRIMVAFGRRAADGSLDPAASNALGDPPMAAPAAEPFGPRIEWLAADGRAPCAATVRLRTASGEVLLTGSLAKDGPWTRNRGNAAAREAAVAACEAAPATEAAAAGETARPGADATEGKALALCSQCASPALVTLEGAGTDRARATARLTRGDALAQCRTNGFIDVDNPKEVEACADDAMENIGGRTYGAEADCDAREITDTAGTRYRFERMGEDYGGTAPLWRNLSTGQQANVSRAGDSARVTQQFATLCPGAFAAQGFDRFAGE